MGCSLRQMSIGNETSKSARTCSVGTKRCGDGPLPALPAGRRCVSSFACGLAPRRRSSAVRGRAAGVGLGCGLQRSFGLIGDAALVLRGVGLGFLCGGFLFFSRRLCRGSRLFGSGLFAAVFRRRGFRRRRRLSGEQQGARDPEDREQNQHAHLGIHGDYSAYRATRKPTSLRAPSPKSRAESRRSVTPECFQLAPRMTCCLPSAGPTGSTSVWPESTLTV